MKITVAKQNAEWGPYSPDELRRYVVAGNFTGDDLCWHEGLAEWTPIRSVVPLPAATPPPRPPTSAMPAAYAQAGNQHLLYESQKKSAGLACLLNFIIPGVGYMYAGRVLLGIFVFLIWVICLCLCWLVIPLFVAGLLWLVGLIDGYLAVQRRNRQLAQQLLIR